MPVRQRLDRDDLRVQALPVRLQRRERLGLAQVNRAELREVGRAQPWAVLLDDEIALLPVPVVGRLPPRACVALDAVLLLQQLGECGLGFEQRAAGLERRYRLGELVETDRELV